MVPGEESLRPVLEVRDPERQEGRGTDSRSCCRAVTGGPVPQCHSFLDQVRWQCGRLTSEKDSAGSFQTQSLYCHPLVGAGRRLGHHLPTTIIFLLCYWADHPLGVSLRGLFKPLSVGGENMLPRNFVTLVPSFTSLCTASI